ncbi:MAG: GrpB family protein [Patescibacteria group bacterium]
MLGLNRNNVILSKYDPAWTQDFEIEKKAILDKFGDDLVAIEHIGSTAIPDMIAKPLIDFMVAIDSLDNYERFVGPLRELGYEIRKDYRADLQHVLFVKGPEENRTHYLKLTELDSNFWKEHIVFRDYLIAHPDVAEEYKKLKQSLFEKYAENRTEYTKAKAGFIESVLARASEDGDEK